MNPQKIIGSPILLALVIIFGAASWAILGFFGASSTTLDLYCLLVMIAAATSIVCMVKNIVSSRESKLQALNLNLDKQEGSEQGQRPKEGIKDKYKINRPD